MLFILVCALASAYGFGIGMAIVIWRAANESCCLQSSDALAETVELKKSA